MLHILGAELREARLEAGVSQGVVASLVACSHNKVGRIERGVLTTASIIDLAKLAAVLGLDLSVKVYPDGPPIRDAAHVALLERLKAKLGRGMTMRTEVPMPLEGDRRAWDALIQGRGFRIGVEAETRLRDVQALTRRIGLKQRDAGIEQVILVVASTRTNRRLLGEFESALRGEFPLGTRSVAAALRAGVDPGGSGVLVL